MGHGAQGHVYLSTCKSNENKAVAIKVIEKSKVADKIDQIVNEVQELKTLKHANIVKYDEIYMDDKHLYLVMEYVAGHSLFEAISKQTFDESTAAKYMRTLFEAVKFSHSKQINHRDIKPENIIISESDTVHLIDFGVDKDGID